MADLILPEFHEYLERVTLCASLGANKDAIPVKPTLLESTYLLTNGEDVATIRLILERHAGDESTGVHFHFDFQRTPDDGEACEHFIKVDMKELIATASALIGNEAQVSIACDYSIPRSDLPEIGTITSLLGVETISCGYDMHLTGAEMAINGEEINKLKWSFDESSECITANLSGYSVTSVTQEYLKSLFSLLRDGLHCFILESTMEFESDADDNDSVQKPIQHKKAE